MSLSSQLQSLVNRVGVATNRPHLEAEIIQAILDATAWYHSLGEFPLDSYDGLFVLSSGATHEHTLDLGPLIPRLRSIREVAVYSQACARTLYVMKQVKSLRPLNCDEARITGTKVHVHSCRPQGCYKILYYKHPDLAPATFDSWIVRDYEGFVLDEALRRMYELLKDNSAAASYAARVGRPGVPGTHATVLIQNCS